jgi:hypothetical protein
MTLYAATRAFAAWTKKPLKGYNTAVVRLKKASTHLNVML